MLIPCLRPKRTTVFARKQLLCSWSPTVCIDFVAKNRVMAECLFSVFLLGNVQEQLMPPLFCFLKMASLLTIPSNCTWISPLTYRQLNHIFTWLFHNVMFHGHSGMLKECTPGVIATAAKRYWPPLLLQAIFIGSFHYVWKSKVKDRLGNEIRQPYSATSAHFTR